MHPILGRSVTSSETPLALGAMQRGRVRQIFARQHRLDGSSRRPDEVIVEEPLTIRLDDETVATTMRTPGHDFELAVGFLHGDGQLDDAVVETIRYCAVGSAVETEFNTVSVETGGTGMPKPRLGNVTASCGLCGSDAIDELIERIQPLANPVSFDIDVLRDVADKMVGEMDLFARTGAAHGAAAFDASGALLVVREDIGRHNAVDKVVGRLRLDDALPALGLGLFVSGRASFEMVQKAWAGGFSSLLAVSAPSALAVEAAKAANMQLVGFVRGDRINEYSVNP